MGPARATTLVLGHGAGGGTDALDLRVLSEVVLAAGFRVVLVDQPWRVAGRRIAPRPATLDAAWLEVVGRLRTGPLVVGGRSAGARVACRTSEALGASGVLAMAFPLHPPGRPEVSRVSELRQVAAPMMVVQGARDPFGTPGQVRRAAPAARVVGVSGADHALRCGRDERLTTVRVSAAAREVASFLGGLS
jgi:predicted alpha/beta-hydrolase family hydrolase